MTIDPNALLWTQPDWLAQAHAWIHAELDRQNLRAHWRPDCMPRVLAVGATRG